MAEAAGFPLPVAVCRKLLLAAAEQAEPGQQMRLGAGFLDIGRAVHAAREAGRHLREAIQGGKPDCRNLTLPSFIRG